MPSYVIDTDIASGILFGEGPVITYFEALQDDEANLIFVSEVTRLELLSINGLTPQHEEQIEEFISCCDDVITVDRVVAHKAAELRRMESGPKEICNSCGKRKGGKLKTPDSIVAATAVTEKAVLVTRNVKDYKHLVDHVDLQIENPYEMAAATSQSTSSQRHD